MYSIARIPFLIFIFIFECLASAVHSAADEQPVKVRISGVVVDEQGEAVAGVRVQDLSEKYPAVTTDAAGRFEFSTGDVAFYSLILVAKEEKGQRWGHQSIGDASRTPVMGNYRLVLKPTLTTTVKVLGPQDVPVADAEVYVEHGDFTSIGQTDASGTVVIRLPASSPVWHIAAGKAGVGFDYHENFKPGKAYVAAEPTPAELTLRLRGARSVKIKAEDSAGKPLAGMTFAPWRIQIHGKQHEFRPNVPEPMRSLCRTTDAQGIATFDWLPIDGVQSLPIRLVEPLPTYHQPGDLEFHFNAATKSETPVLTIKLLRGVPLKGRVVMPDGSPAPGVMMQAGGRDATNPTHYTFHMEVSDKDGAFDLTLPPEKCYMIGVQDTTWAAKSVTGIVLKEGDNPAEVRLQLIEGTLIQGRVTKGLARRPLAGALVTLVETGNNIAKPPGLKEGDSLHEVENLTRWVNTDSEGRYSLRVGPGTYEIKARGMSTEAEGFPVNEEATIKKDFHIPD